MHIGGHRAGLLLAASAIAIAGTAEAGETVTYTYDALGRLTATSSSGAVNNGIATSIGYDPAGNRANYMVGAGGGTPPPPPPPAPPPPPPPANQPPTTFVDSASIPRCGIVTRSVAANDTDPEGNYPLVVTGVSYAGNKGTATLSSSTSVTFESNGVSGTDSITYTVQDSLGAASTGTFNVTITTAFECP